MVKTLRLRHLRTIRFDNIAFLQEGRVRDSSGFAYALRRQLLANKSSAPTDGRHVSVYFIWAWQHSPVSHASELDVLACAVFRFDVLYPFRSNLFRGREVSAFPSLKIEVWVTQWCRRVLCYRILEHLS